jgi:GntR family transcriptional regulator
VPELQQVLPKYLQIAGHIRDQIVRGDLRPGDEVPSERELAASWKVARPTAARALESLRTQGLVESRQGSGTYVRASTGVPRARERYDRARALGSMYGVGESVRFLDIAIVPAPSEVAEGLRLDPGAPVIRRPRVLSGADGGPIELSTSWFDAAVAGDAPGLLRPERLPGGTGKYLGEQIGRAPAYARDEVAARLASSEERKLLSLPRPSAVLVYRLTAYDTRDRPVQYDEAVYPPQRWAFHQEYPLPG